jgi:hypothetical protein
VLANDFDGLGVDRGFINIQEQQSYILFPIDSLSKLKDWPEDTFGDAYSTISIFGLKEDRKHALIAFLQTLENPQLKDFLQNGELFIDMVIGKEYGFFNSFLIKSKEEIGEEITAFENIVDSSN